MRKRSKIRIPQDVKPWARIIVRDDENINIFSKKSARWFNENRRYLQTKLLINKQLNNFTYTLTAAICRNHFLDNLLNKRKIKPKLISLNWNNIPTKKLISLVNIVKNKRKTKKITPVIKDVSNTTHRRYLRKFFINKYVGAAKVNNFCLFLGKASTYNRKLFISRQTVRKLTQTGLILGLQKH